MGASLALAGVQGCIEQPQEQIVPYVRGAGTNRSRQAAVLCDRDDARRSRRGPVGREPHGPAGESRRQSAASGRAGDHGQRACRRGRMRFGATDAFAQAVVLSLYDPDRSQTVLHDGQIDTWESFLAELQRQLQPLRERGGQGLRMLTGTVVSPTLGAPIEQCCWSSFPSAMASVRADEPRQRACWAVGWRSARMSRRSHHVEQADVILSLDADFLVEGPMHLQHARGFADRRRCRTPSRWPRSDEPAVRRRIERDAHRRGGRSSVAAESTWRSAVCSAHVRGTRLDDCRPTNAGGEQPVSTAMA